MKNMIIFLAIALSVFCTVGCTTLKRYRTLKVSGIDNGLADVNLFRASLLEPVSAKSGKNLWDLSADAQPEFIKILNKRFPDNKQFFNSLSFSYMNEDNVNMVTDYATKDLHLVFSVSKSHDYIKKDAFHRSRLSPADRIEYIRITLRLKDPFITFKGWNKYVTEYGSIDIGDVSFSRSLDLTASVSSPTKKAESALSYTGESKASMSRKEDQSLKYRYLLLNGKLDNKSIEMEEEGTRETDLAGNIMAEVSLKFNSTKEVITRIRNLKDSSGIYSPPKDLIVDNYLVEVPDMKKIKKINADLKMEYIYRNVKHGRKTYGEWDDRVKHFVGRKDTTLTLFTDRDYVPEFCGIGFIDTVKSGDSFKTEKKFVTTDLGTGDPYPLIFTTYEEASLFQLWLLDYLKRNTGKPVIIGDQLIKFGESDLTLDLVRNKKGLKVLTYYR